MRRRLSDQTVSEIRSLISEGLNDYKIAKRTGVSPTTVSNYRLRAKIKVEPITEVVTVRTADHTALIKAIIASNLSVEHKLPLITSIIK